MPHKIEPRELSRILYVSKQEGVEASRPSLSSLHPQVSQEDEPWIHALLLAVGRRVGLAVPWRVEKRGRARERPTLELACLSLSTWTLSGGKTEGEWNDPGGQGVGNEIPQPQRHRRTVAGEKGRKTQAHSHLGNYYQNSPEQKGTSASTTRTVFFLGGRGQTRPPTTTPGGRGPKHKLTTISASTTCTKTGGGSEKRINNHVGRRRLLPNSPGKKGSEWKAKAVRGGSGRQQGCTEKLLTSSLSKSWGCI